MNKIFLLTVVIAFPVAANAEAKVEDRRAPDAIRCVKVTETGSLVKKHKICKTNAEWRRYADNDKRDADEFVERHRSGSTSN